MPCEAHPEPRRRVYQLCNPQLRLSQLWLTYKGLPSLPPSAHPGGPPHPGSWARRKAFSLHTCHIIYSVAGKFQNCKFQFRDSQENDYKRTCCCSGLEKTFSSDAFEYAVCFLGLTSTVLGDKSTLYGIHLLMHSVNKHGQVPPMNQICLSPHSF